MKIVKYSEFVINETKKSKDASLDLIKMIEDKPNVDMANPKWPNEKGIYSQAGMIKYFKGKYTTDDVLGAIHLLTNDKTIKLENIKVKNYFYKESLPYYYVGLSKEVP